MAYAKEYIFSPDAAMTPDELGIRPCYTDSGSYDRLVERELLVKLPDGRYYLNSKRYERYFRRHIIVCAVSIVGVLLNLFMLRFTNANTATVFGIITVIFIAIFTRRYGDYK